VLPAPCCFCRPADGNLTMLATMSLRKTLTTLTS
jgi:hypothetical protein